MKRLLGVGKGLLKPIGIRHQTPSRIILTQNPIRVKVFLLKFIGIQTTTFWTVGSRHPFSGKQRAADVNGYWHRAPDDSTHKRNPGNGQLLDAAIHGYVLVEWHGCKAAILSLCLDLRTAPISYAKPLQA